MRYINSWGESWGDSFVAFFALVASLVSQLIEASRIQTIMQVRCFASDRLQVRCFASDRAGIPEGDVGDSVNSELEKGAIVHRRAAVLPIVPRGHASLRI